MFDWTFGWISLSRSWRKTKKKIGIERISICREYLIKVSFRLNMEMNVSLVARWLRRSTSNPLRIIFPFFSSCCTLKEKRNNMLQIGIGYKRLFSCVKANSFRFTASQEVK